MTTLDQMLEAYRNRRAPLDLREEEQNRLLNSVAPINDEIATLTAKVRVTERCHDEALADGRKDEASKLTADIDNFKARIDELQGKADTIGTVYRDEMKLIRKELHVLADKVLAEVYPGIREKTHAALRTAIEALEDAWQGLQSYARQTGAELGSKHKERLVPSTSLTTKDEQKLASAVNYWLTGSHGRPLKGVK